jgi:hypothetical protein
MILSAQRTISRCTTDRGKRPTVKLLLAPALALVFAFLSASPGFAQDQNPAGGDPKAAPNTIDSLTGKERLGRKWMDEQRIDNCKIPTDKQGAKPRSSACPHVPMG